MNEISLYWYSARAPVLLRGQDDLKHALTAGCADRKGSFEEFAYVQKVGR